MSKKKSKKPNVTISRNKNKFTISWKKGETYEAQKLTYYLTPTKGSATKKSPSISKSASSKSFNVDLSKYYPKKKKYLKSIKATVSGHAKKETWASDSYTFLLQKPTAPSIKADLQNTNKCRFSWSKSTSDTSKTWYVDAEWEAIRLKDCTEKNGKKLAKKFNRNTTSYLHGTGKINDHHDITEDSALFVGNYSYSRWFRVRLRGPRGCSAWKYTSHTYSQPNKAKITGGTTAKENAAEGIDLTVVWEAAQNKAHQIDKTEVQYVITIPGPNVSCPSGLQWTSVQTPKDTKHKDKVFIQIDDQPDDDQVMFVRVNTYHDNYPTYGTPKLVAKGPLKDPDDLNVETVEETHRATISATNMSEVEDSFLVVTYAADSGETFDIGIIPHGQTSITVQCPNWSNEDEIAFEVRAVVGSYTKQTREDGVDVYDVTALLSSENTIEDGGEVPKAPDGISVFRTDVEGTIGVTWDWTWDEANGVQLAWADHEDAWESTDQPETFDIPNIHASRWNISDLEVGITWYVRLRFYLKSGDKYTYGPWSDIESGEINLSSAPSIPVLELSDYTITEDGQTTASWVYVSNDKTPQEYAEIDIIDGNGVYTPIAHAETAQHVVLDAVECEFEYGNTYELVVAVKSSSGRLSEWSDPVYLTIAEPVNCEITNTSLIQKIIATGGDIVEDNVPYTARLKSDEVGDELFDTIVGGTLVWNQLANGTSAIVDNGHIYYANINNIKSIAIGNGSMINVGANDNVIDLTMMFGDSVADYIYSMEQAYTGSGIAIITSVLGDEYYNYNSGQLMSVNVSSHLFYDENSEIIGEYALDSSKILRGIPKIDDNGNLCYDGDIYDESGVITRNYEQRTYQSGDELLDDAITDGVNTVIKLNEPITESAQPYVNPQGADDYVIEAYDTNTLVPVGHNTLYAPFGGSIKRVYCLTELPLSITAEGAGEGGITSIAIERAEDYPMERPDGKITTGYKGETVALEEGEGEDPVIFNDPTEFYAPLDDGAKYNIVAQVNDGLGQIDTSELPFEVHWDVQAIMPTAEIEVIGTVVKITPYAEFQEGSYCDIYRLSVDRPELIVSHGAFGTGYVDPYPALNEFGGHRIVFKTKNGDYIDQYDVLTWYDTDEENGDIVHSDYAIIDFDEEQIEIEYGLNYSSKWSKDFKETKYLGGSVEGDWNKSISRSGDISGAVITITDADKIASLRRLADYAGICHVRTPDGSSYAADIQVKEDRNAKYYEKISTFSLSITRVDSQTEDGITYQEWIEDQE